MEFQNRVWFNVVEAQIGQDFEAEVDAYDILRGRTLTPASLLRELRRRGHSLSVCLDMLPILEDWMYE